MPRRSVREARRRDLTQAYVRVLGRMGLGGATLSEVAREAGVAPGLIHHHFRDRDDLSEELVRFLARSFRERVPRPDGDRGWLGSYVDAALAPGLEAAEARAWVGVFAEGLRTASVGELIRRALTAEHTRIREALEAEGVSPTQAREDAAATLAMVIGSLVFGAFVPKAAPGFAAKTLKRWLGRS